MGNIVPPADYASLDHLFKSYDFAIVGGGQSGLALASRLTEDLDKTVLVLEAGSSNQDDPKILTPPFVQSLHNDDRYDWRFETEPQTCYDGRHIPQPRGKGLGGSSAIHMNMMVMPSMSSLDDWEQLGNNGWSFDSMKPYLKKFHTFRRPSTEAREDIALDYLDGAQRGRSGPIQVSYGKHYSKLNKAWTSTFESIGHKCKNDPMTGLHYGAYNTPASIDPESGNRSYAANTYLNDEVVARPNLRIATGVQVERILLEEEGDGKLIARGVQFRSSNGQSKSIRATETILAAGVFQSPQLLEVSGIGNPSILQANGIKSLVDLPGVGENLQDHAVVGISFESNISTLDSFRDPQVFGAALSEYQTSKSGPLATSVYNAAYMPCMELLQPGEPDITSICNKHLNNPSTFPAQQQQYDLLRATITDPHRSSVEYMALPLQLTPSLSSAASNLSPEAKAADYITLFSILSHPFSRGTVHTTSPSPSVPPSIDPRYFTHPLDLELEARHLTWLETLVRTQPLASLLKPGGRRIPEGVDLTSLAAAKECIKTGSTTYHPCGTCAMMPRHLDGVVDERLRVYGVRGLRVVDASVFPLIPRGNIQSVVYAVAEKAADLIKEDWRRGGKRKRAGTGESLVGGRGG